MKLVESIDRLREVSPVAAEERRLRAHFDDASAQSARDTKLREAYEKRADLVRAFQAAGLVVSAVKFKGDDRESVVYEDLSAHDDGGKLVEAFLHVPAFTNEQVMKIYEISERNNLGVMTVGARTSALGVFAAWDMAKMRGLDGVVCLDMPACWDANQRSMTMDKKGMPEEMMRRKPADLLRIPSVDPQSEKLTLSENLPIAVIESLPGDEDLKRRKHRVIAHATVTVAQINEFLAEVLPKDAHYQILPDLTSKEQAALGGVIATGAQGGNRASARVDLQRCTLVDAIGVRELEGNDAKMIVGYNGYLGTCTQAEFEVTKFPKHQFGFLVPISGTSIPDAWQNALKFQARLAPHCVHPDRLQEQPEGLRQTMVSSMEILGPEQLRMGIEKYNGRSQELKILLDKYPGTQIFVYVSGSTHHDQGGDLDMEQLLKDPVFAQTLQAQTGLDDDLSESFEDSLLKVKKGDQVHHEFIYPLFEPELLKLADAIRHSAPEVARAEAEKIGNVTQSTDFNIQFTGPSEQQERARARVASLYAKYHERFSKGPYRVDVYGHMFPGFVPSPQGGGADFHIRVSQNLGDADTRNDAPERVIDMNSAISGLYVELLSLHGTNGIVVAPPEKSHLTNHSYVKWVRLHNPGMMCRLQERFLGDLSPDERRRRMMTAFRLKIEFPDEPRSGIKSFFPSHLLPDADHASLPEAYADAVLEISQLSHRGPEIKGMFREVVATLRERLKLHPFRQHPFFIESVEEGRFIIERNLGVQDEFKTVEITSSVDLEQLEDGQFDPNNFYLIPSEYLGGIPGMCVMITPHKAILKAYDRKRGGQNKEVFRNLVEMFDLYPYETPETPNIPAVAALGLALQRDTLAEQKGCEMDPVVTINPGPTQLHPQVRSMAKQHGFLQSSTPEEQQADIEAFRRFMLMPEAMKLGFTGSATQCMQLFGEALGKRKDEIHVLQLINGAFAERMKKILGSHGLKVSALSIPWTTSANSQVEFVANELVRLIDEGIEGGKKPVLFVTPHETSTTAHFHPESLVAQLKQRGLVLGQDYELVCDITSGAGGIDYFTEACRDGMSVFGSDQKALGCPAGLGFFGLSEGMSQLLLSDDQDCQSGLLDAVGRAQQGSIHNTFALRMLGEKCRFELSQERTVVNVQEETRKRVETVMGFMAIHPDLCYLVPSAEDHSQLLVGKYTIDRSLPVAIRLLDEIFGYRLGAGYGPFSNESMRLYLATTTAELLDAILSAFHVVLEMPEVTKTVNPSAPVVPLREPHDPLQVLETLVREGIEPDDIFRNNLGLGWIRRLINTKDFFERLFKETPLERLFQDPEYLMAFNVDDVKNRDLFQKYSKSNTYGSMKNLVEVLKILNCHLTDGQSLMQLYTEMEQEIDLLRVLLLNTDTHVLVSVSATLKRIGESLKDIVHILKKYAHSAHKTRDGRIIWPIVASSGQLVSNGNGHANGNGSGNGTH